MSRRDALLIAVTLAASVGGAFAAPIATRVATSFAAIAGPAGVGATSPAAARAGNAALPRLVFVSRAIPRGADAGLIPGLGPLGRLLRVGGRLMLRERDGRVHALLAPGTLFDASDPCVSWDAKRVVFAGTPAADSAWRVYVVDVDGSGLRSLTVPPAGADDFDPAWLPDGRVCFASTRGALRAEGADVPAANLWIVGAAGGDPVRITAERNGAEEPAIDPASGRILYARWWTNRFRASAQTADGITADTALAIPADDVDLWQVVSVAPDGDGLRLAAGDARDRDATMGEQPAVDAAGRVAAVRARDRTLVRERGRYGIQRLARLGPAADAPDAKAMSDASAARGAKVANDARGASDASGAALAGEGRDASSACAPAWLPDGRLLYSRDVAGRGDFALAVIAPTGAPRVVLDLPGTAELDAAPIVARVARPAGGAGLPGIDASALAAATIEELRANVHTFRFDCLNVFANGPLDLPIGDAPPPTRNVRIRFFAALARPGSAHGDTAVLVREANVGRDGSVHEHDLPGDVPMFEQLVDSTGRVLMGSRGPVHVAGFNFARAGGGTKCVGCHVGHSAIEVPASNLRAQAFNAAPSAIAFVSAALPQSAGAHGLIDRRAAGDPARTAWLASAADAPVARLVWASPIEVRSIVLYALGSKMASAKDAGVGRCDLILSLGGREVGRLSVQEPVPGGAPVDAGGVVADALEIRPQPAAGRRNVAIAEVETFARIP